MKIQHTQRMSILLLSLALAGCHSGQDEAPDAPSTAAQDPDAGRQAAGEDGQSDLEAISALLRARHTDDLPDAETLKTYPEAEAALRQLGREGETMVMRTRALALLRFYASEDSGALLAEIAGDGDAHPALRAAAITGLAGQSLADQPARMELVVAALRDEDPRVGTAAVEVLDAFPAGKQALQDALKDESSALSPAVRQAISER